MKDTLCIFYVGNIGGEYSTCLQRMRALMQLGRWVRSVNSIPPRESNRLLSVWSRINDKLFRLRLPHFRTIDLASVNDKIPNEVREAPVDVLWVDKGLMVQTKTLREVKKIQSTCIVLGYSSDDMAGRHNQSWNFSESLAQYDVYFTTKTYGVAELQALACPRVHFVASGFDPDTHRPVAVSAIEKKTIGGEVGFVGSFETERAGSMQFIAAQGVPVHIDGGGWENYPAHRGMRMERRGVFGSDYAKVLCACDMNLCFLRRVNRDR
jgi:hypothetical protein